MKYLKYLVGLIAVLFIGFLLIGVIKPRLSYDCEIMVEKPAAESWAVVQDEEKLSEWLPGMQKIENISGTPGTVGAVSDVYYDANGKQMIVRETITDLVPDESISMVYHTDFMDMDYKMTITPVDSKTKISSSTTVEGKGLFSRSMTVLFGASIKEQEMTNLSNLKNTIETNTKDYFNYREEDVELDSIKTSAPKIN